MLASFVFGETIDDMLWKPFYNFSGMFCPGTQNFKVHILDGKREQHELVYCMSFACPSTIKIKLKIIAKLFAYKTYFRKWQIVTQCCFRAGLYSILLLGPHALHVFCLSLLCIPDRSYRWRA